MLADSIVALAVGTLIQPSGLTEILYSIVSFAIILIVLSIVFYLAGLVVVGGRRALFRDAFAISALGTLVLIVCLSVFSLEIAIIISLIAWLLLVRYYYETGLSSSIAVGLTSVIVAVVILVVLSILLGLSDILFRWLPSLSIVYYVSQR
jgi:hypothetical protein